MSDKENPLVSIAMAVYNGEKYISETIQSILNQAYQNFELIIVDDCSQDDTIKKIEAFNDSRIVLLRNEKNMRLAYSLNRAIDVSKGKYIARMDADDLCKENRLCLQVDYMEKHPGVAVLGGNARQFGAVSSLLQYPQDHELIKVEMLFTNPVCHPAVMFRKYAISEWYDPKIAAGQDYELWSRLIWKVEFRNLPSELIGYRVHEGQTKKTLGKAQKEGALRAYKNMLNMIGAYTDEDVKALASAGNVNTGKTAEELNFISELYGRVLADAVNKRNLFSVSALRKRIERQKAILVYASLIFKTLKWKQIAETKMLGAFLKRPGYIVKAFLRSIISK